MTVDKSTVERLARVAGAAVAGGLIHGWHGAIAGPIVLLILVGLVKDHCEVMAAIARRMKQ